MIARFHNVARIASVSAALMFGSAAHATPVSFMDLGIIGKEGVHTFTTNGSGFDTELGLWSDEGKLIASNDDGGIGLQSRIRRVLSAGVYYLGVSEFNSRFRNNFRNVGSGFERGETEDIVLNHNGNRIGLFADASDQLDQETAFFKVTIASMPTPAGMSLAGTGLVVFGFMSRRRKVAQKA